MATLFNTKISATYEGLFKTIDNAAITASLKELTDGSGNQSGLYVNNAGDFKVSNILEWGSLKDTGTGVTITRYVTSTDGIENFDNNTSLPTSAAVKLYVDSKFATSDTLQEVLSFGNTTGGNDIAVSAADDITFTDTSKILMGNTSDLQIYHDNLNTSYIKHITSGDFRIQTSSTGYIKLMAELENMAVFIPNNAVELYYDNSKKLATTNTGVDVTGNLVVSGTITGSGGSFLPLAGGTMTGNTLHGDNVKSIYGTSNALEIYGSTDGFITSLIDDLVLRSADDVFIEVKSGENAIIAKGDGAVELYNNNVKKLETTLTGVSVTGALSTTTNVSVGANATFVDNGKAVFGNSQDLEIYHNTTTNSNYIQSNASRQLALNQDNFVVLNQSANKVMISAVADGAANLFFNDTKRIETVLAGAKVTGNLEVTGTITGSGGSFLPLAGGTMTGDTIHNDNVKSIYGTASDGLEIYHTGTASFIKDTGTGNLIIDTNGTDIRLTKTDSEFMAKFVTDAQVELYYNGSKKFETTSSGISVTGNGAFTGSVTIPDNTEFQAGTGSDLLIGHNAADSYVRNSTGSLLIDQAAVTQSIVFRVSDANALDTTALTISRSGDLTTGRNVTIAGDLTVNGTTTTVNSQTLAVVDPLIQLAKDNTANSLDIGLYGDYNDGTDRFLGLFSDASDSNKFKLFKGTTVEPTTTVDIGGAGYVAADLQVAGLEATTGVFSTSVTVATASPLFRLTDTDNSTNIDLLSIGGAFILNSTSDQVYQIGGTEKFRVGSSGATFAGSVSLLDSKQLTIGSGNDLRLFHTGGNSYIENVTGDLYLKSANAFRINSTANESMIIATPNAAVELYYDSSKKFETTTSGVTITGGWVTDGVSVATANVEFTDNSKVMFGNGNDLQIYHDGSNSYINEAGTGVLTLQTNGTEVQINKGASEYMARFITDGAVNLYYDNSKKFETTSTGVSVTGTINATDRVNVTGSASDLIYYEGSRTGTGVTLRLYDNAGNQYFDSFKGIYLRVNQLGGSTGTIGLQGGNVTMSNDLQVSGAASFGGNVSLTAGSLSITGDGSNAATLTESSVGIFTIASVDDIILDAGGDIAFDAGGDDIRLRVNGTTYGSFNNASSNLNIFSTIQDKSIKFLGNDNGTDITALTLNMADGGDATFSGKVTCIGVDSQRSGEVAGYFAASTSINANQILHVRDNVASTTVNSAGGIKISSSPGNDVFLVKRNETTSSYFGLQNSSSSEFITVNMATGNVGIGVNPTSKLDVVVGSDERLLFTAVGSAPIISAVNGTNGSYKTLQLGGLDLKFLVEGTERVQITNDGNLLINQTPGISETKLYVEGSNMPETGDAASVEDMFTLYRYGSATVWSGGASLALGRYSTGNGSAPKSRLDFKLKNNAGTNTALPDTTVMTMQSNGAVGIGTVTPQKPLHIEGVAGSQMLVTSADDTIGTTAGILLRAEGGEANSALRSKGGVFFERQAANGLGDLILAVNGANNNDSATKTDAVITLNQYKRVEINKHSEVAPTLFGENYTVTPASAGTTEINCFTGIIPETGIYDIFVKGNPNAQGSAAYASTFAGYISIACDFISSSVQFRISQATIIQDGGGSSNRQLVVAASLYNSANNTNLLIQPISAQATTQILINVSQYINTAGTNQDIRIVRRL